MDDLVKGGRVGAILDLRGSQFDVDGNLVNGQLQEIINQVDGFAKGLIESTNNLYAQGSKSSMQSDSLTVNPNIPLYDSDLNIQAGSFDVIIYDTNGEEAARRTININSLTVMDDTVYDAAGNIITPGTQQSIIGQLNLIIDDNQDSNATNDLDDMLQSIYAYDAIKGVGTVSLEIGPQFQGYTFGVEDNTVNGLASGTNFSGALGLSRFFEGSNAQDITLERGLKEDPALIKANKSPVDGDNKLAIDMLQLQFDDVTFEANGIEVSETLYGYYDAIVTDVGTRTNAAITTNDTVTAKYNAILQTYESISKVNIDEEMVNLIKYQTAYGASAKIITTIDQMMDTLLGLKR